MKVKNKIIQLPKENMSGFPYNLVAWKTFKQKGKIDEFHFHKNFCKAKKDISMVKEKILKYFQLVARIAKYF